MTTVLFVVSDLHLGGEPDFQMCSDKGQSRLCEFFTWVGGQGAEGVEVRLVLAGDIVDFLAEGDAAGGWSAFAKSEEEAEGKLELIARRTEPIWTALKGAVGKGVALTLMLGNHDVELSLPAARRKLLDRIGPGRVEFIYDNEAYRQGPVIVEHGNRYDAWNVVAHNSLREARSRVSRREPIPPFPVQPGSELVARVMNRIKSRYAFVDLLKPETSAVVPILAALDPWIWLEARSGIAAAAEAMRRFMQYDENGQPTESDFVAGTLPGALPIPPERAALGPTPEEAESLDAADSIAREAEKDETSDVAGISKLRIGLLLQALRLYVKADDRTWAVDHEASTYRRAAETLVERGFKVVVFGHTHLAKRVLIGDAVYLNTGTWADLLRLPPEILRGDKDAARKVLESLLDDVRHNRLDAFRRPVPTFARIEIDRNRVRSADVLFFDGASSVTPISTEGFKERLAVSRES